MHPKATAIVSVTVLILSSMPSSAHEHGKTARVASGVQLLTVDVSDRSIVWDGQSERHQSSKTEKPAEPEVQRTEAGIRIVGTPFFPPLTN